MIDNDVLEALLRDAAEKIEVPSDGPARVLAARPLGHTKPARSGSWRLRRSRQGQRRTWRPPPAFAGLGVIAAILLLVVLAVNLSGSGPSSKSAGPGVTALGPAPAALGNRGAAAQGSAAGPTSAGSPPAAGGAPTVAPKVIQTGSVNLQVGTGQVNSAMARLTSEASALGGFVASTNTQTGSGPATGDITLRVPATNFDALLNAVRGMGKILSMTTSAQDVTAQYANLGAQLQSLEDTRAQFERIMTRASSIGDIISVEQQINDLQSQIQQLQSQLQVMDNQATYGTLAVHVTEAPTGAATVPHSSGLTKAWDHARHTFARGLESVVGALGGIAVFLLCVAALGLVIRLGWGVMRRRLV